MKYRLIKWYPSLPIDWEVGDIVEFSGGKYPYQVRNKKGYVIPYEVENNPEFWEKVEKKDYKVLTIKCDGAPELIRLSESYNANEWPTKWKIYSVKRLSDGEVFTIGDNLYLHEKRPNEVLSEIKIIHSEVRFRMQFQIDFNHSWSSSYTLNFIQHAKPLFTTHDGVPIYEGDTCYFISNVDGNIITTRGHSRRNMPNFFLYFSSREKALKWLEENEKEYSKKEKGWKEFKKTGLLLFTNQILHVFGWAIFFEYDDNENLVSVYPARTKFRGFDSEDVTNSYQKISKYLHENIDEIYEEGK